MILPADPIPGVQFIPGDEVFSESSVIQMAEPGLPDVIGTVADLRRVVATYDGDISGQLQYLSRGDWQIEPHIVPWVDILRMELLQIEGAHQAAKYMNGVQSAGLHSIYFNAEHLPSGLYIYRLQAGVKQV